MTEPGKPNISEEAIPLLCEAVDLKSLNITPEEGFILSRIDGQVRVRHLVSLTGLGKEQTFKLIQSLVEKGVITIHQPRQEQRVKPREEKAPARIIIDPAKVPKGEGFKEYVEKLYEILPRIDYFQLLGVSTIGRLSRNFGVVFRRFSSTSIPRIRFCLTRKEKRSI